MSSRVRSCDRSQSYRCQRAGAADGHAGAVADPLAVLLQVVHFPEMRDLVVGARSGARGAVQFHRKAHHRQPGEQPFQRGAVAGGDAVGMRQPAPQPALHQRPGDIVDSLDPERVRDDPVAPGRHLARQVAVAPAGHLARGLCDHVQIAQDGAGGTALDGLLEPALRERRARRGVAVHRGGSRDTEIGPVEAEGRVLDHVVDDAGADCDRGGVVLRQHRAQAVGKFHRGLGARLCGQDVAARLDSRLRAAPPRSRHPRQSRCSRPRSGRRVRRTDAGKAHPPAPARRGRSAPRPPRRTGRRPRRSVARVVIGAARPRTACARPRRRGERERAAGQGRPARHGQAACRPRRGQRAVCPASVFT